MWDLASTDTLATAWRRSISRRRALGLAASTLGLMAVGCSDASPLRALRSREAPYVPPHVVNGREVWPTATPTGPTVPSTWTWIADDGAPEWGVGQRAVWAGTEMIVWGTGTKDSPSSGRYDPRANRWNPMSQDGAPRPQRPAKLLWTGRYMLVWDVGLRGTLGRDDRDLIDAGRYDPAQDRWYTVSGDGAPYFGDCAVVWTGSEMIAVGSDRDVRPISARYNPEDDTWRPISLDRAPRPYAKVDAVWTGEHVLVWSGSPGASPPASGGLYDPVADMWRPIALDSAFPSGPDVVTAWTGTELLIWDLRQRTGRRFNPRLNRWRAVADARAPRTRVKASAVWTGNRFVVWGGLPPVFPENVPPNTHVDPLPHNLEHGAAYDPATDRWQALPDLGRKSAAIDSWQGRHSHLAVWTGPEMIVWGGTNSGFRGSNRNDGARWRPFA